MASLGPSAEDGPVQIVLQPARRAVTPPQQADAAAAALSLAAESEALAARRQLERSSLERILAERPAGSPMGGRRSPMYGTPMSRAGAEVAGTPPRTPPTQSSRVASEGAAAGGSGSAAAASNGLQSPASASASTPSQAQGSPPQASTGRFSGLTGLRAALRRLSGRDPAAEGDAAVASPDSGRHWGPLGLFGGRGSRAQQQRSAAQRQQQQQAAELEAALRRSIAQREAAAEAAAMRTGPARHSREEQRERVERAERGPDRGERGPRWLNGPGAASSSGGGRRSRQRGPAQSWAAGEGRMSEEDALMARFLSQGMRDVQHGGGDGGRWDARLASFEARDAGGYGLERGERNASNASAFSQGSGGPGHGTRPREGGRGGGHAQLAAQLLFGAPGDYLFAGAGGDPDRGLQEVLEQSRRMHLLDELPREKFCPERHSELTECELCLMDYEQGDELMRLPCLHLFHNHCVKPWLQKSYTCPVCQINVCEACGL
eukprot:TRINITY_DN100635_c0_g1_i1.p1 TRINITY_DN100635_c0_g1~~TRINITY_DN100635_c0_g1_i1.p1  ORF type:complete len:491 (-),score=111.70 TRINITY_DN100635_c0_g1_i1:276-1748(-)